MKHAAFPSLTFSALAKSAAEMKVVGDYGDFAVEQPDDPAREVAVFLDHEQIGWHEGWKTIGKEVIGVCICNLDDPHAEIEIMNRDEAVAFFGIGVVQEWESME